MSGFDNTVVLEVADCGTSFQLTEEAVYNGSQGDAWVIPRGFKTDFATIPAIVSWATPKLGAYTLAAIVHDLLCEGLNDWERALEAMAAGDAIVEHDLDGDVVRIHHEGRWVEPPTANAVDTDAIFRKIARDLGTDAVTAALLWVGVRWGALANPARRAGWLSTAPKVLGLSLLFAPVLIPATVLAVGGRLVLRLARKVFR